MNHDESQKVLDELQSKVRPRKLNKDAKRLYDAIIRLKDERDFYKEKYFEKTMKESEDD